MREMCGLLAIKKRWSGGYHLPCIECYSGKTGEGSHVYVEGGLVSTFLAPVYAVWSAL